MSGIINRQPFPGDPGYVEGGVAERDTSIEGRRNRLLEARYLANLSTDAPETKAKRLTDIDAQLDALSKELPPFPSTTNSCAQCFEGWSCEQHPKVWFPHPDKSAPGGQCAGPGMPCLNGCLGETKAAE